MKTSKIYKQCSRCVMDTTAAEILFNNEGECNFCTAFHDFWLERIACSEETRQANLNSLLNKVRVSGRGKPYDCIVGVSGGVDSSWTLVEVKRLGLRPLAVHMDNGWNSEQAQNNIANLVRGLKVDLYTYVIDWEEYRDLMKAFFNADVIDVELLYDNAMFAVNYNMAAKYKLNFILAGTNVATEGINIPKNWNWYKFDKVNIYNIAKKNSVSLRTFPSIGTLQLWYFKIIKKVYWTSFLDYLDYDKAKALQILQDKYQYKPYGHKHYESIFTRFYQGYILPKKFNVDKRKLHFSSLVMTGQLKREEALNALKRPPFEIANNTSDDIKYFCKKVGWTEDTLTNYLARKPMDHDVYGSEYIFYKKIKNLFCKI